MINRIICKLAFLFISLTLAYTPAIAQFEEGKETVTLTPVAGAAIVPGANNTITYANTGEASKKIKNIVTLKINEQSTTFFKTSFTAVVYLKIESWAVSNPLSTTIQTQFKSLAVNYDTTTGAKYNARAYILLDLAEQVKITVDTIDITGYTGWDPKPSLQLENEMRVLRYYNLSNNTAILTPAITSPVDDTDAVGVSWTWNAATNNNISQLEWAWLSDEMAGYYASTDLIFQSNSSRVDLDAGQNNYKIPLLYGDTGKLYYRVRAALRKNDGSVIAGPWSSSQKFPLSGSFTGHQTNLNWQSSTSFAENGKFKTVIQYFDGTQRSRQTVTKDNSTGNTVVAETIYDLQGRPNVQILPTPTIDNTIHYFNDFNRFIGQQQVTPAGQSLQYEDPAKYFDLSIEATKCNGAPKLDSTTGTGKYYSSLNSWLATEGKSKYIPNAEGYAYTETRFLDDATQRVSNQGGVGQAFQINGGHTTKYFYGKPAQQELDALFGTEVGDASHYSKNMVQDGNGQMSVSYTDMHGRTIATALAGDSTPNLYAIYTNTTYYPSNSGVSLTNQLLTPTTNIVSGNSIQSVSTILAPVTTVYNFTYKLDPATLSLMNCSNQQICFDCKYDLEISIRPEDCNNTLAIVKKYNNLQITPCGSSMGFTGEGITVPTKQIDFAQTLTAGSWIVRKSLTINDSLYSIRKDSAQKAFLCRTEQNIYDSVYNVLIGTTACYTPSFNTTRPCDSCNANLGVFSTYRTKYLTSIGVATNVNTYDADIQTQYTQDSLACAGACGVTSVNLTTLKSLRNQLLSDMVPYTGQYAIEKDSIKNPVTGVFDPKRLEAKFNIFTNSYTTNPGNVVTPKPYYYQYPKNETGAQADYLTEDNHIDLTIQPGGNTNDRTMLDTISPNVYVNLFQRSWAKNLIYYHPEFKKLKFAEDSLFRSYAWLDSVQACTSYATALAKNYLTPLTSDPYFINNYVPGDKIDMQRYLTNNLGSVGASEPSIWQVANANVSCATKSDIDKKSCLASAKFDGIDLTLNTDSVWEQFKNIYLGYRNDMVVNYINSKTGTGFLTRAEMDSLQSQNKQLIFVTSKDAAKQTGLTWWSTATGNPANSNNVDTAALTAAATTYVNQLTNTDKCIGQKPFWKSRLLQCEQLQNWLNKSTNADTVAVNNIINVILDSMVMVCHNSASAQQPYGNSTVNPTYAGLPKGFEEVINHVFTQNGIASIADSNYFCNPFTIDFPKPYGKNPPLLVNNTNTIDTCGCKRFSALKIEAKAAGYDTLSLTGTLGMNQFLTTNYNDSLTTVIWQGLQKCNAGLFKDSCTYTIAGTGVQTADTSAIPGCPIHARITSVAYLNTTSVNNVQVNYISNTASTNCILTAMNVATSSVSFFSITCGSSSITISLPACQNYRIYINTGFVKSTCYDTSNVFTLPACTQTCKKLYIPILLQNYVVMPPFLSCDYQKPCITCSTLNALVTEFRTIYPTYTVPYTDSLTITAKQLNQNSLLARFLNYRTGFSKNTNEYLAAIKACIGQTTITALCSFKKPVNDVTDIYVTDTMPCRAVQTQALFVTQLIYQQRKDSLTANFDSLYKAKCLGAKYTEQFYATYQPKEYHYTLYYYDQAGNLIKTLPPAAVKPNYDTIYLAQVNAARLAVTDQANVNNNELLATQYRYNSLNQVLAQKTPDAGISKFWYDRLGRLAVSQNAKQILVNNYSYTLYDALGRITEVGQKPQATAMTQLLSQDTTSLKNWLNGTGVKEQITYTKYDESYPPIAVSNASGSGLWQANLRNRVSYTYVKNIDGNDANYPWDAATFYSYDIHGNVDTLLQDYKTGMGYVNCAGNPSGNRFKKMIYCYDLISGKVNDVAYQPGQPDQYYHHYNYDAENRLTEVKTSKDKIYWEREALYDYYRHGPLARTVLGQNQVQGLDYVYTLQGWLRGVNGNYINLIDVGGDGKTGSINSLVAIDAYAFTLGYYTGDYKPIGGATALAFQKYVRNQDYLFYDQATNYYNGNISYQFTSLAPFCISSSGSYFTGFSYYYDQLNRLRQSRVKIDGYATIATMGQYPWPFGFTPGVIEDIQYDPNGNITKFIHRKYSGSGVSFPSMDSLTYFYNKDVNGNLLNNKLQYVTDQVAATGSGDIDNQAPGNYSYDAIGNLTQDVAEGISNIDWSVYGKIKAITKTNGTTIKYTYDASGNRISKIVTTSTTGDSTYYVRDASGNVMSVYNKKSALNLFQTELHLYGSSRLAVYNVNVDVQNCSNITSPITIFTRGNKIFELSNHLGNVLSTISDKKIAHTTDGTTIDYYNADVVTANDYSSFGMQMIGRKYSQANAKYRYGFNGQEKSDEIKGEGNSYTAEFWEYDPRTGRRWNVDPVIKSNESPYLCFGGNPIYHNDPLGDDYGLTTKKDKKGKITNIKVSAKIFIKGDGASAKRASELTKAAKETYKTKTVDGVEVSFDVEYTFDPNKKSYELNDKLAENVLIFTSKPENDKSTPRDVSNIASYLDPVGTYNFITSGYTGTIHNSGKDNFTVLHESLHLLGLSDRYSEVTGKPYKGYEKDIMGSHTSTLSLSHYKNIIEYTQRQHELITPTYPNVKYIYSNYTLDLKYENSKSKLKR